MTGPVFEQPGVQPAPGAIDDAPSAGAQLRALREAAQLTLDDVAHQLKLARRQVVAIENDDLDALPGPTFVRGFIRNYARLLRVDAEALLQASNLVAPAATAPIQQLAPTMGELPLANGGGPAWVRWLIPVALILVLIAGVAYYEFTVVPASGKKARKETSGAVIAPPATSPEDAPPPGSAAATEPASLPPVEPPPSVAPQAAPAAQAAPATPPVTATQANPPSTAPAAAAGQSVASGRLDFEFAGPSWVEVRDARGEVLLQRELAAGDRRTLTGMLPLTLRIGNASVVRLQFDGNPIDLVPHTRAEIARLTLAAPRP